MKTPVKRELVRAQHLIIELSGLSYRHLSSLYFYIYLLKHISYIEGKYWLSVPEGYIHYAPHIMEKALCFCVEGYCVFGTDGWLDT